MQEQAINTFEEGLVMDLNPLTTPNNVLTNALNGTMITFNGNEFVLQNDMGNGRVETAYLPSGYVPVGIKEYGGIIYVASYNPITNKGQIGSFPSPERNISSEEKGISEFSLSPKSFGFEGKTDIHGNLIEDVGSFEITSVEGNKESIGVNTAYTKLALLKDTSILRPGDKFAIQFSVDNKDKLALLGNWIENYYNTTGNSNLRLLRIKIAISDSNGYLVDITKNLKRIANGELIWPVPRSSDETEEDYRRRQYDGYFMQFIENNEYTPPSLEDTRRAEKFLNVYNNKLAGTLYLVAELATIDNYELQVKGVQTEYTEGEKVKHGAKVEFITSYTSEILDTYKKLASNPEDYWYGNKINLSLDGTNLRDTVNLIGKEVQYSSKERNKGLQHIELNLTEEEKSAGTGVLTYDFLPNMKYGKLESYKKSGFIDLNLLGSGKVTLNKWQYYTNLQEGYSMIRFGFAAYPAEGESITKVVFTFYDIKDYTTGKTPIGIVKEIPNRASWHGDFQEILYYGQELKSMTLYIVAIDLYDEKGYRKDWSTSKWLYTTELFNDSFNGNKVLGLDSGGTWDDFDTFNPYPIVQLSSGLNINKSNFIGRTPKDLNDGKTSIISGVSSTSLYNNYKREYTYTWDYAPKIHISDNRKYPFDIEEDSFVIDASFSRQSNIPLETKVPVGSPKDPANEISEPYIKNRKLYIKIGLHNYVTANQLQQIQFRGTCYKPWIREDNVPIIFGGNSTFPIYRLHLKAYSLRNHKQRYGGIRGTLFKNKVNLLGEGKVVTATSGTSKSSSSKTWYPGWSISDNGDTGEGNVITCLRLIENKTKDTTISTAYILPTSIEDVRYDNSTNNMQLMGTILWRDTRGELVLLNAKLSFDNIRSGENILSILENAFGYLLIEDSSNVSTSVYKASSLNYWKEYLYNWKVDIVLKLESKPNMLDYAFKIEKTYFNNDTIEGFVHSISSEVSNLLNLPDCRCVSFTPNLTISDVSIAISEKNPDVSNIVTEFLNPQLDGKIIAMPTPNTVLLGSGINDNEDIMYNKIYAYINGHIWDTESEGGPVGTDKLQVAKLFKLSPNKKGIVIKQPKNYITNAFPQGYNRSDNGGYGAVYAHWQLVNKEYNATHYEPNTIYSLMGDSAISLTNSSPV